MVRNLSNEGIHFVLNVSFALCHSSMKLGKVGASIHTVSLYTFSPQMNTNFKGCIPFSEASIPYVV